MTPTERPAGPRALEVKAIVLEALVAFLEADGIAESFRAHLSEPSRRVLQNLPPPEATAPAPVLGESLALLLQLGGREKLREFGAWGTRTVIGPRVRQEIERLRPDGGEPADLLGRLHEVLTPVISGVRFHFLPEGRHGGVLTLAHDVSLAWPLYVVWEGALPVYAGLCGLRAGVGEPQIAADHRSASYRLRFAR